MLIGLFAFVVIVLVIVFGAIKSSEPVEYAYGAAKDDARVHAVLGQPVSEGYFVSGSVDNNGSTGSADLSLPVSGPKGSGTLYVVARKQAGQWQYQVLQLEVDGKFGRINLLSEPALPRTGYIPLPPATRRVGSHDEVRQARATPRSEPSSLRISRHAEPAD
jgi:hypothetical protein